MKGEAARGPDSRKNKNKKTEKKNGGGPGGRRRSRKTKSTEESRLVNCVMKDNSSERSYYRLVFT